MRVLEAVETVKVNVCYRPLRICWAISAGDLTAFRAAAMLSHTMWGGRFNPIAVVERADEAQSLVEVFRADMIVPIGDSEAVKSFEKRFPHLISPLHNDKLFFGSNIDAPAAQILDIHNLLFQLNDTPALNAIKKKGFRVYQWDDNDPLRDVFLMHLGRYPSVSDTKLDYGAIVSSAMEPTEKRIDLGSALPPDFLEYPSIAYLCRHEVERHYGIRPGWNYPGFYVGDAANVDDLVCFWNLRATDTALLFVDGNHLDRYRELIPAWKKTTSERIANRRFESERNVAVWLRPEPETADVQDQFDRLKPTLGEGPFMVCRVGVTSWNGLNVQVPMMTLGETAQLGVLSRERPKPKLSFALADKPFSGDLWFHTQHLVASLSFIGGMYGDELHTLSPPYVPELNEFYARTMHFHYDRLRVEPDRIGIVIDAADTDAFVFALPVAELFERVFRLAGLSANPSSGGLIARQLIAQLDGLRGAAAFRIPGVRRLLKTFGPNDAFTADDALNKIGSKDPANPTANFKDFEDLYIEPRPHDTKLQAGEVFAYLVEKRLFRMGSELKCPHCRMSSWVSLDTLKQQVTCEMCGSEFDATRQLITAKTRYRRSGVLGAERNAQGAVPVCLTLHQLDTNIGHSRSGVSYTTSLDLVPETGNTLPTCEVDFVWLMNGRYPGKTTLILGECKDRGRGGSGTDEGTIDESDIKNLKAVADALPSKRFDVYILLAKLRPFTESELTAAKALNDRYRQRAILLTDRELEPWHLYDRTRKEFKIDRYASSAEELAGNSAAIYFADNPKAET